MAVLRRILRLALATTAFSRAAAAKGFLDLLLPARSPASSHSAHHSSQHRFGRTILDALKLALKMGSSEEPRLEAKEVPRAHQVFNRYDSDMSGVLTSSESSELLRKLGFTDTESVQMQAEMDTNRDGVVDFKEFDSYITMPEQIPTTKAPSAAEPLQAPALAPAGTPAPKQHMLVTEPTPADVSVPGQGAPDAPETAALQPLPAAPGSPPVAPLPDLSVEQQPAAAAPAAAAAVVQPGLTPHRLHREPDAAQVPLQRVVPPDNEDAARKLQRQSARTQDTLVDAFENAQLSEIKRTVFRSLARLRSAQVREFDTIAKLETQAIDSYNDRHFYRRENPLRYLDSDEGDIHSDQGATFHA